MSSTDKKRIKDFLTNAVRMGHQKLEEACNLRLAQLKNSNYLGAFPQELVAHLASLPGRRMDLELPLADQKGGTPRASIPIELSVDQTDSIYVRNRDPAKPNYHSSLSDLRAVYIKTGGGSESWRAFRDPVNRKSIADIIGVDPEMAHESRRKLRK